MVPLQMKPLPSPRPDAEAAFRPSPGGFVDDEVVIALVAGRNSGGSPVDSRDLALAADEDFAGWCLETSSFPYPQWKASTPAEPRRASPPELDLEPGIGQPHHGAHRWWMAGLAGALCTLLFSSLVLSLADDALNETDGISIIRVPEKPAPPSRADEAKSTELTGNPPPPAVR